MDRRTLLVAVAAGAAGLAGCGDHRGTPSGDPPPGTGPVETALAFENLTDATWVADVTFVDQPFERAVVTRLDGAEEPHDVATTEELSERLNDADRVRDVVFEGGATEAVSWTAAAGETREGTVPTWVDAGMVALLFRDGAADDSGDRAFLHTGCEGQAPVISRVRLVTDADGSRSMQAQCGEP